jgi:hypothetical protein
MFSSNINDSLFKTLDKIRNLRKKQYSNLLKNIDLFMLLGLLTVGDKYIVLKTWELN